jgi:ABC-type dipeptide/oligopeptide/nickel transport system permease component
MLQFILKKILKMTLVLLGATLIIFLLLHSIPGNPLSNFSSAQRAMDNYAYNDAVLREVNRRFGLDLPLWHQFSRYIIGDKIEDEFVCGVICGNLGPSTSQKGRSVESILFSSPVGKTFWESQFGYSIRLVVMGAIIAISFGVPLGFLGAKKANSSVGNLLSLTMAAFISIPNFVLGLLAILLLASWLHLINVLPDWTRFGNWIVPAVVLSLMPMANIAKVLKTSLLNIQNEDYVRTARAKGLTKSKITFVHIFRNAMLPFIACLGPTLVELFAGLFIIENLYGFPGFGRQYWIAILKLDYPIIMGLTLFYAAGIALVNVLIDIFSELLDPRIRELQEQGNP